MSRRSRQPSIMHVEAEAERRQAGAVSKRMLASLLEQAADIAAASRGGIVICPPSARSAAWRSCSNTATSPASGGTRAVRLVLRAGALPQAPLVGGQ